MARPVLLTIDDDPEVLRAVERDLREKYGKEMRVIAADSGEAALEALKRLKLRNEPVALLLADQRMPGMTGVELLEQAVEYFPDAKRVLLTAYADTEAAIRAINTAHIDYYLRKPWDPPEERLYPVLDDLLGDWRAKYRPPFEGVRLLGLRWSAGSHQIKDFLTRYGVPYQWLDVASDEEARKLAELSGAGTEKLPAVLFSDGPALLQPTTAQLADRLGLRTRAENKFYDLIIVGAGPTGLAAAVYGASEGLKTLLLEREAPGGQAGTSSRIENYLGFPQGISGALLAERAVMQANRFHVEILAPQEVVAVRREDPYRYVKLGNGSEIACHALLIASGVCYRRLDVPGVERLTGAGIYYGATMAEAPSCRDEDVFIVGGANSAGQSAIHLSGYARQVTLLVRAESLEKGMSSYLVEQIRKTPNIAVRTNTVLVEAQGETNLQRIVVSNLTAGTTETLPTTSLFIMIGAVPYTEWLDALVERDEHGFVLCGRDTYQDGRHPRGWTLDRDPYLLETNVPGVFAAGDVRHGSVKRCAAGVGEGSICVQFVHQYLSTLGPEVGQ